MGFGIIPLEGNAPAPVFDESAFDSRPLFGDPKFGYLSQAEWAQVWLTNHIFQAFLAAVLVIVMWLVFARQQKVIPGKRQFAGEFLYNVIRNGVARDIIGPEFRKYLPYLLGLFSFILVNNLFGQTFFLMFPTFSKIGFVWGLALASWVLYNAVGIKRFGFFGYMKKMTVPKGVPAPLLILVMPLEFISNFITRPLTLALRLFANLFAGHLVTIVFILGGTWLLMYSGNFVYNIAGGLSLLLSFAVLCLEIFIGVLQAYIFTILTAQYVSSALAEEH